MRPDGQQLAEIGELLKTGSFRPVIDRVFPFDQAKIGLAYLEKGRVKGKVIAKEGHRHSKIEIVLLRGVGVFDANPLLTPE